LEVNAQKALLGSIVLTSNLVDHNREEKSFADHYRKHNGITNKDQKQPLLMSWAKKKTVQEVDDTKLAGLGPELSNLTGLTESMKADFKVMKDVGQFTRIKPSQRQQAMQKFLDSSVGRAVASAQLLNWGLRLANGPIRLEGRRLPPEKLSAGKNLQFAKNAKADRTREITTNHCLNGVSRNKWVVVYVQEIVIDGPSRYHKVAVVKGTSADDNIQASAKIVSRPRTGGDFELGLEKLEAEGVIKKVNPAEPGDCILNIAISEKKAQGKIRRNIDTRPYNKGAKHTR
jgi:hypothetical protein